MNRLNAHGNWLPAAKVTKKFYGPMHVETWDCRRLSETKVLLAICRAIDFANAMRCIVCIDLAAGSAIVGPDAEFCDVLEVYFDLRERAAK